MIKISIIVAATKNMVIGKDNELPWNIPTDLKNFKKITDNSIVVMGRKCWESIPEKHRPLSNRTNIVVSRNKDYAAKGAYVIHDLDKFLISTKICTGDGELFIIGGAQIYEDYFNFADKLYLTEIDNDIEGDILLKGLDLKEWDLVSTSDDIIENGITYRFKNYNRNEYGTKES